MNPLFFVFLQARKTEKNDNPNEIPEGFITLERFGELFHQNLTLAMHVYKVIVSDKILETVLGVLDCSFGLDSWDDLSE